MSKKLDSVLEKIQKNYKMEIKKASEACKIDRLTLDSPSLNFIFGGGFALGRIYMLSGPESGGKSTLATYIAAQIQKKMPVNQRTVVYIDFEYSFEHNHAASLGLDIENNFILLRPNDGEDAFVILKELVDTGEVGLVILDSISAIASKSQIEDPNKATFGAAAKVMSNGLKYINPYLFNNNCSMIMVAQERANVGVMYGPDFRTAAPGYAPKYYASWCARLTRVSDIVDKGKGLTGIIMKVRNTKNKVGIPKREAEIILDFEKGINSEDEYMNYLTTLGIVKQAGAYYSNEAWGMKVRGKEAVVEFLHNNPELYEKVKQQVNDLILGHTILDDDMMLSDEGEVLEDWSSYEEEDTNV